MLLHRIIRLLCLAGANIALILGALLCRFLSHIAMKQIIPRSATAQLPALTQTWVTSVADGSFPILLVAFFLSTMIVGSGLYIIFTKRLSPAAIATVFAVICCVGYTVAVLFMASTMMALVIPFLPAFR